MTISGTIKLIMDKVTFDSGFEKREMVVTTKETYPQDIKIEFVKDKTALLDNLGIGQEVEVSINIRGNEYNGKYFVNIQGWKIAEVASAPAQNDTDEAF